MFKRVSLVNPSTNGRSSWVL